MGVFSEMDIDRHASEVSDDVADTDTPDLRARAEEIDDARQEAEAAVARATLAELTRESEEDEAETEESVAPTDPAATDDEAERRRAHEEAEAARRAEWEAKRQKREEEELFAWENAVAMEDDELVASAVAEIGEESERLTRRNIRICVAEILQTYCRGDANFARQVKHPRKSMSHCYRYITRKAKEYILQELKAEGRKPSPEGEAFDIPDGVCYQWAIDYFNDMDAPEDKVGEEEFVPRPYVGKTTSTPKKKTERKKPESKKPEPKKDPPPAPPGGNGGQLDMFSDMGGVA